VTAPSWSGRARGPFLAVVAVGLVALGVALLVAAEGEARGAAVVVLVVAVIVGMFVELHTEVTADAVTIRSGPLGWPRQRIALEDIDGVDVTDLSPLRWGGWGYRGSLRFGGRAAWVARKGPALELALTGGRRLLVTVDHAEDGAAVLRELLGRATPPSG
jgi:hypothetical protein